MKKIFLANDKFLYITNKIINVVCLIGSAVSGFALMLSLMAGIGVVIGLVFGTLLFFLLLWLIWKIRYAYLMDIKHIRNILYGYIIDSNNELQDKDTLTVKKAVKKEDKVIDSMGLKDELKEQNYL